MCQTLLVDNTAMQHAAFRKILPKYLCLSWLDEWEWVWEEIGNCLVGKMGMGFKFQMGMGMVREWEWSHWNGKEFGRKICSFYAQAL